MLWYCKFATHRGCAALYWLITIKKSDSFCVRIHRTTFIASEVIDIRVDNCHANVYVSSIVLVERDI